MCLATKPTPRRKPARPRRLNARLMLMIGPETLRLWPHTFDPSLDSEERHVLEDADGQVFSVFEQDIDMDEALRLLIAGGPIPRRWHCEKCVKPDCRHVAALIDLGLL